MLPDLRKELNKKLSNKTDAPAEKHGIWRKMSANSMKRTKPRSTRLQKFGHYQRHPEGREFMVILAQGISIPR